MNPHAIFMRNECALPEGLDLRLSPFCEGWMISAEPSAAALDAGVRKAGWHFIWLQGRSSRVGFGRSADSAVNTALHRSLQAMETRFNGAELESMTVRRYPGFEMARVTLAARQIQRETLLEGANAHHPGQNHALRSQK